MDLAAPSVKEKPPAVTPSRSSFLVLTLFLFTPARISIGNFMEFSSLVPGKHAVVPGRFARPRGRARRAVRRWRPDPRAGRIVSGCSSRSAFLAWLQGNILLWHYGVLDGKDIDWGALVRYGIIDSVFWAVVMAFAILAAGPVFTGFPVLARRSHRRAGPLGRLALDPDAEGPELQAAGDRAERCTGIPTTSTSSSWSSTPSSRTSSRTSSGATPT